MPLIFCRDYTKSTGCMVCCGHLDNINSSECLSTDLCPVQFLSSVFSSCQCKYLSPTWLNSYTVIRKCAWEDINPLNVLGFSCGLIYKPSWRIFTVLLRIYIHLIVNRMSCIYQASLPALGRQLKPKFSYWFSMGNLPILCCIVVVKSPQIFALLYFLPLSLWIFTLNIQVFLYWMQKQWQML